MQAVSMLVGEDSRLFFIIGMDRAKVAAGVAAKYEQLIPYLTETDGASTNDRLAFGYTFLEKFIQIPYRLPQPGPENLRPFLRSLANRKALENAPSSDNSANAKEGDVLPIDDDVSSQDRITRRAVQIEVEGDTDEIAELTIMVAPVFDFNPRRLKHFINLFRLKAYLASEMGLFDQKNGIPIMTLAQLAKFTAIAIKWPTFIDALDDTLSLFKDLNEAYISGKAIQVSENQWYEFPWESQTVGVFPTRSPVPNWPKTPLWLVNPLFRYLLSYGVCEDGTNVTKAGWQRYDLALLDPAPLLKITASIPRSKEKESAPEAPTAKQVDITPPSVSGFEAKDVKFRLNEIARDYENIRKTMSSGNERTARMTALASQAQNLISQVVDPALPENLFATDQEGDRLVALALVRGAPKLRHLPMAIEAIRNALSPFEQFVAMQLADNILKEHGAGDLAEDLSAALSQQKGVPIHRSDLSRWNLRNAMMNWLQGPPA